MLNVTVYIGDGYVKGNGESTVYLVTHLNRQKCKFNTGVSIKSSSWDPEKNRIRASHPQAKEYNLVISSAISKLTDIFVKYKLQNIKLTPQLLKKEYKNNCIVKSFYVFMEDAIAERRGEITDTSIKQHQAMMSKLKEFAPDLMFSEIDDDFLKRYNRHLISKKLNNPNTRHNNFKNLKAYLNIAVQKGIILKNPLMKIPVKRSKSDPTWLTHKEFTGLVELYHKKYLPDSHQRVLRHYLFSCVTGLRISDLKNLKMDDIIENTIVIIAHKTKNVNARTVKIPLCSFAKKLIKDEAPFRMHGIVFDMYSEYRTRLMLKEAVAVNKIKKNVNFHSGRHTFATLFLSRTKNIAALQKLLGHARIEETMIYTHLLTGDIEKEIACAFEEFN